MEKRTLITYKAAADLKVLSNGQLMQNGTWSRNTGIEALPNRTIQAARRYFRIGTTEVYTSRIIQNSQMKESIPNINFGCIIQAIPWTIKMRDPSGQYVKGPDGNFVWEGYCIELIQKLADMMDFDYDLVIPEDGEFGQKVNGVWNGLVGDLAKGVIIIHTLSFYIDNIRISCIAYSYHD